MGKFVELPDFHSEPLTDWSKKEERERLSEAIKGLRRKLGGTYSPLIAGGSVMVQGEKVIKSVNPSSPDEVIGYVYPAGRKEADKAINSILHTESAKIWAGADVAERAMCLRRAAQLFRDKRFFFIALGMLEVGKTAPEMDAEVAEGIDFLEYYAAYAPFLRELNQETLISLPGERNTGIYEPLGIGVSIQPWNFPFAISIGPAAAALVMGNSIIYKPAEQSSVMGCYISRIFYRAGIPKEVFHYLPGYGEDVGNYLVNHPEMRFISFTGSRAVADIIEDAVHRFNHETIYTLPPQSRFRKQIATMEAGGKNAIIVDSDADPDEAVIAVSDSAFGYAGQKCSACSRVIVIDDERKSNGLYDILIRRLRERVETMPVGSPENPSNQFGPLISKEAYNRALDYIRIAEEEGVIVARGKAPQGLDGYFVPPVLVCQLSRDSKTAQEEIFGPVLAVFRVSTFDEALELANNTEFGLTGGIISRNPEHIARYTREMRAGNIYINRKSTGAMPARQPFGGIRQSGNGTKAGGWDYLLRFVQPKNVAENTTRRGAPLE